MRPSVHRALLLAFLAPGAAGCSAAAAGSGGGLGPEGGRYQVLVPAAGAVGDLGQRDADRVAAQLRRLVSRMRTHTAMSGDALEAAMRSHGVTSLDSITARQLAQSLGIPNVLYVVVGPSPDGLVGDAQFIDVESGDVIRVKDVTAPDAGQLAELIFTGVERSLEGVRFAGICNDLIAAGDYQRALDACNAALSTVPSSTAAQYGKATALLRLERYQESLDVFRVVVRGDSQLDALLGAGLAASNVGLTEEALGYYDRYLEANPTNVEVRMTVAGQIASTGDYVAAYRILGPAISAPQNRTNTEFQRYLFTLAAAAGQRVAIDAGPSQARPYFEAALVAYGRAFGSSGSKAEVAQIRQAISVNVILGRMNDALALAREATVQYDSVPSVWSQYASTLAEANRHLEAAQAYTRVLELDPEAEQVHLRRGIAYLAAGQREQGMADLQRALREGDGPAVVTVLVQEAQKAISTNDFVEAERLLGVAAEHASAGQRPQISFYQGFALFQQGNVIARSNGARSAARAREALILFQRALPLLRAGEGPNKVQMITVTQQYIANQQAIVGEGRR